MTILLLILFAILATFFEMIALNDVSERQVLNAMTIALICQGIVMVLAGIFARWFTNLLITKFGRTAPKRG